MADIFFRARKFFFFRYCAGQRFIAALSHTQVDEQLDYPRYIASCCQTKTGGQLYDRFPAYVGPARQVLCQIYADERERRTIDRHPAEQRGHSG